MPVTIADNRTGAQVEMPIEDGAIRATALKELGLASYDPAFPNTASVRSAITETDGDAGMLRYRGYPIELLAGRASYLETRTCSSSASCRPRPRSRSGSTRTTFCCRTSTQTTTCRSRPTSARCFKMAGSRHEPEPALVKALEVLFILHAGHEQNCSANAMRAIGSSQVDPYPAMAGAAAALYGPLHGGANEAVLRMLAQIGSLAEVPALIERVKAGEGRLMGFGHRIRTTTRGRRSSSRSPTTSSR